MKKIYTAIAALSLATSVMAQIPVMHIELNDGSVQTFRIADIREMTFGEEDESSLAEKIAGEYTGANTMAVGTLATYTVLLRTGGKKTGCPPPMKTAPSISPIHSTRCPKP